MPCPASVVVAGKGCRGVGNQQNCFLCVTGKGPSLGPGVAPVTESLFAWACSHKPFSYGMGSFGVETAYSTPL